MTLGHSEAIEESVWSALEGSFDGGDPGAVEVVVTTRAQRDARGAVTEAFEPSVSIEDLTELREIASRSPGAGEGPRRAATAPTARPRCRRRSSTGPPSRSRARNSALGGRRHRGELRRGGHVRECFASASAVARAEPRKTGSARFGNDERRDDERRRTADSERRGGGGKNSRDESEDAVGSLGGDSDPVFRRVDLARMSFVGYYKDEQGKALSKPRIYSSSGESHGVSRSIGDRGSARACVATPEIAPSSCRSGRRALHGVQRRGVGRVLLG